MAHLSTQQSIGDWINLLLLSEGMMLLTVIMCIWSNRVEFQRTVLIGSNLIENSKTDFEKVKTWTEATSEDYHAAIIDEYIQCLGHAEDKIARNANSYKWNITVFTIGLISLSICLPIVLTLR